MLTIVTPATEFKLITEVIAREALFLDQSEDSALTKLIKRASDVIARECNRIFAEEEVSETFRLKCREDGLLLSRFPVSEIASVVENDTTLTASDYELGKDRGGVLNRIRNDRDSDWPLGKIVVTYTAGYALPHEAPQALQQACLQLVKSYYIGADRDPMMRSGSVEQLSSGTYFDAALPPDVLGLIEKFRKAR